MGAERTIQWIDLENSGLQVSIGEPVVVALSEPGEQRWGYFQFPKLSKLPDGGLLVTFNVSGDDDTEYGRSGPANVSYDEGKSWKPYQPSRKEIVVSHSPISAVGKGEFLCFPAMPGMKIGNQAKMPASVGGFFSFFPWTYYRLDELPGDLRQKLATLTAYRWTPQTKRWKPEQTSYELQDALVCAGQQPNGVVLARTSFEYPLLEAHGNLYHAEYKFRYVNRDGTVPASMAVTCMVSKDTGRTFERRGTIAEDRSGNEHPSETHLALTTDNGLVAIGRASSEKPAPSWISFSDDEGHTWSPRQVFLKDGGKQPTLTRLENGVIAVALGVASGNKALCLCFSPDGNATTWTQPLEITRADGSGGLASCSYTGIVNLAPNAFLLAYSDFDVRNAKGKSCKGILVRRIEVNRIQQ
jgi:hypothetical protein